MWTQQEAKGDAFCNRKVERGHDGLLNQPKFFLYNWHMPMLTCHNAIMLCMTEDITTHFNVASKCIWLQSDMHIC